MEQLPCHTEMVTPTPIQAQANTLSNTQANTLSNTQANVSGGPNNVTVNPASAAVDSSSDDLGQLNGMSSRKTSGESPTCQIPPENQITCAVEIHREKTKTPTAMMAMTEQPASATTTTATATSTPKSSPAPSTRSPLPHELCHMRETIV